MRIHFFFVFFFFSQLASAGSLNSDANRWLDSLSFVALSFPGPLLAAMLRHSHPLAAALIAVVVLGSTSTLSSTSTGFKHSAHTLVQEDRRRVVEEEGHHHQQQQQMDWAGAAAMLEKKALEFVKGVECKCVMMYYQTVHGWVLVIGAR